MVGFKAFANALTAVDRLPPPGLAGPSERRFAVYRNNVAVGLIRALETQFPALLALVGEEFFRAMAREFMRHHPPSSPLLTRIGDELPGFLAGFAPAGAMPYLADIARLEIARTRAYHAPDSPRLGADAFAALAPAAFETLHVALHPAVTVIRSPHPLWSIFSAASGRLPGTVIDDWQPQAVRVDRPELDPTLVPLTAGTALFLEQLAAGIPLGVAAERAATGAPEFDLSVALATLIGDRLATRIKTFNGDVP